jgi:drug/metabolite transporter (DMT)-like permease
MLGIGAMLVMSFCYAWSTIYIRKQSYAESPTGLVLGQMVCAAMYLPVPGVVFGTPQTPRPLDLGLLLVLGVLATAVGNLIFFYLIARSGPTQASSVGFLVPLFGLLWAVVFLHEAITANIVVGMGIVLLSVALVNEVRLGKPNAEGLS